MGARVWLTLSFCLIMASPAMALEVYGRIWNATANRPMSNASVMVTCAGRPFQAKTDKNGVYRMGGPAKPSKCSIQVAIDGGATSTSFPFYISLDRTRANFALYRRQNRWLLVRR